MTYKEKIEKLATLENAKAYANSQEKYTFCADLLGCSVDSDMIINMLEDKFDDLLETSDRICLDCQKQDTENCPFSSDEVCDEFEAND